MVNESLRLKNVKHSQIMNQINAHPVLLMSKVWVSASRLNCNGKFYCEVVNAGQDICGKRILHHDNAPIHNLLIVAQLLVSGSGSIATVVIQLRLCTIRLLFVPQDQMRAEKIPSQNTGGGKPVKSSTTKKTFSHGRLQLDQ